jgi:DNA-binding Lrp family transcriptional regulator
LALLGGTWTPNVVLVLREGPRRFNELRGDLRGVSGKTLSARLKKLEADGVGQELVPPVDAIVQIGHRLKQRRAMNGRRT